MSFFKFNSEDIINTEIVAYPRHTVILNGNQVTGSVYLEKKFLQSDLLTRRYQGYSERLGGFTERNGPLSSSVEFVDTVVDGTNKEIHRAIDNLYRYYSIVNANYTSSYVSSNVSSFRVITIPEIYYDREICSGTFSASDYVGGGRNLYDDGRGGIYSGSLTGTLVGNIFYSEGIVVLKKPDLSTFGAPASQPGNSKWQVSFKGTHKIPVKIFRCRAPAGELNCSTNPTFYTNVNALSASNRNENTIISPNNTTYITKVGIYNDDYELVAVASLAQPIRKEENLDLQIRLRYDL